MSFGRSGREGRGGSQSGSQDPIAAKLSPADVEASTEY